MSYYFMMNDDNEIKEINTDIIFYFLTVISSLIAFYIINEKKNMALGVSESNSQRLNDIYVFNRRLVVFINIYFFINVYNNYIEAINNSDTTSDELYQTKLIFWGVLFGLIGSLFYLPITNSNFIIKR